MSGFRETRATLVVTLGLLLAFGHGMTLGSRGLAGIRPDAVRGRSQLPGWVLTGYLFQCFGCHFRRGCLSVFRRCPGSVFSLWFSAVRGRLRDCGVVWSCVRGVIV